MIIKLPGIVPTIINTPGSFIEIRIGGEYLNEHQWAMLKEMNEIRLVHGVHTPLSIVSCVSYMDSIMFRRNKDSYIKLLVDIGTNLAIHELLNHKPNTSSEAILSRVIKLIDKSQA